MSPCKDCIKLIAAAGIKTIYFRDRYKDYDTVSRLAKKFKIKLNEVQENG
jgi:deoxycytidylate deaminase